MDSNFLSIGMMSGTSLDGIDVAALYTDGKSNIRFGPHKTVAYNDEDRQVLFLALSEARAWAKQTPDFPMPESIAIADALITQRHAEVLSLFLKENQIKAEQVYTVGFHGQTILHNPEGGRPEGGRSVQIGDCARLAELTEIDVVGDFRAADILAGGQGAPLVPLYHASLAEQQKAQVPLAVLNVGGVANITFLGSNGVVLGFDTGPGNALLDDWVFEKTNQPYDKDGLLAMRGSVDPDKLLMMLNNPYFERKPPKSLDRNSFSAASLDGLSAPDGAATLTTLTALGVACALPHLPEAPAHWIICGGGRHNPVLLDALTEAVDKRVMTAEEAGWPGDEMEAQAFAWLAVRARHGLPTTLPETTGCVSPTSGGKLFEKP